MSATAERPLTPQQRAALDARDCSVSLSAGAGCGKTFVLTERFLSHVDPTQAERADLQELVAITFTDAAAREMRDRIRRRSFERLQRAADEREAAAWQRLMRSMDGARISTIHSFCTQLLRSHAVEAGLDSQFEVLDAATAELMKLETVDDRLRALLLANNEDVLELAAKRGLDRVRSDVAALAGPLSLPAIERWKNSTPAELVARWEQYLAEEAAPLALQEVLSTEEAHKLRRLTNGSFAASDRLHAHLTTLSALLKAPVGDHPGEPTGKTSTKPSVLEMQLSLDNLRAMAMVQGICKPKDWHDAEDYEEYKLVCKAFRDRIDKSLLKKPFDAAGALEAAKQGLSLLRLVGDVTAALERAKSRRNQLEFDDLLARAHRLLTDPANAAIRKQVAQSTQLLMVDEFQDTNPLQVAIIKAFCGDDWAERGLFAVGDFKQSIYRFNGAEPRVSIDLRNDLPAPGRLSLTRNFRSQPAVTDFVNAIFVDAFDQYEPLIPARPQATPTPAIEFLWTPGEKSLDDEGNVAPEGNDQVPGAPKRKRRAGAARDAREREAQWIARRLAQLLRSEEKIVVDMHGDSPEPRPLKLGDIAILLRSLSDAQVYEEALREQNLEYYLAGGHAFYSQQEIYDVLNLFRAVSSEVDEIALAGALRSPLFALADETLFWLVERHKSLNGALAAAADVPPELTPGEAAKVRRAAATMARLREEKDRLLVADLFTLAMELTGYDAVLLTEFLGPRKAANIEKLIEQARTLDRSSPGDLTGFITQLTEFVSRAPKEALAATQSEENVIRIMTIHYSKGLEFPLVVLPDLDRPPHPGSAPSVLDENLGPLVSIDAEEKEGTIGIDLYRHAEDLQELEERKRLLYVACTRAADYLILSSSIDDPEKPRRDWLQLIDQRISLVDGDLRSPLPEGYGVPRVRVIAEEPQVDDEKIAKRRGATLETLVSKTRQLAAKRGGDLPRGSEAIPVDAAARRRFSFSQLTGALAVEADDALGAALELVDHDAFEEELPEMAPASDGERGDGRALGSLVHATLERLDFKRPQAAAELCEFLAPQFLDDGAEPSPALVATAVAMVERFLSSPRGKELAAAKIIRREVELLLPWPPGDTEAGRYFHGYIDCLYQGADDQWRLLDYKTNRIAAASVDQVASQYELQMLVYALAVEQGLGAAPVETALELLDAGVERCFTWSDAQRQQGINRINDAMTKLLSFPRSAW